MILFVGVSVGEYDSEGSGLVGDSRMAGLLTGIATAGLLTGIATAWSGVGCSGSKIRRRRSWRRNHWRKNQSLLYYLVQLLDHYWSRGKKLSTNKIILRVLVIVKHVQSTEANSIVTLLH